MAAQRIYALFQTVADAERALGALHDHGISRDHIGVAARRPAEADEAGRVHTQFTRVTDLENEIEGEPQAQYRAVPGASAAPVQAQTAAPASSVDTADNVEVVGKTGITTTTPQDAAAGAAVGGGIGLIGGLLLAAAAITIPGVGLVIGGGALAAAFGAAIGTTAAGAVAGGATGFLRDMGMPEHAAQHVQDRLTEGDYLVTVEADPEKYDELKTLLLKYNAAGVDINVAAPPTAPSAPSQAPHAPNNGGAGQVFTPQARDESTSLAPPLSGVGGPSAQYDLREAQIVDPVLREPAPAAVPRDVPDADVEP